jgi:hypothetical protein
MIKSLKLENQLKSQTKEKKISRQFNLRIKTFGCSRKMFSRRKRKEGI